MKYMQPNTYVCRCEVVASLSSSACGMLSTCHACNLALVLYAYVAAFKIIMCKHQGVRADAYILLCGRACILDEIHSIGFMSLAVCTCIYTNICILDRKW
jgi:hypothetical protein